MAEPSGCIYDEDRGYAIHTWTGKAFYPKDIHPEDICIEDIAHGLAMTCRYGGQCDTYYSVAQHSVHCYDLATPENEREALLHDAVEAYLGADFPRPYKLMVPALAKFEESIEQQLNPILGIPAKKSDIMKFIDETMLATEMPLLFQKHGAYIEVRGAYVYTGSETIMSGLPPRLDWDALPSWTPEYAEERFLEAWDKIQRRETEEMVHRDDAIITMRNIETLDEARIASIMNGRAYVTHSFLTNLIEVAQQYRKQS